MKSNPYAEIPQVERLLEHQAVAAWSAVLSRPIVARIVSKTLEEIRTEIRNGGTADNEETIVARLVETCRARSAKRLRRVVNATGVILHTNLGRSPLPGSVWEAASQVNTGYSNLEMDLDTGERGGRNGLVPDLLEVMTGCESALIVNNNAAAVYLILCALAKGKEVVVSRGEQVQIGGGFRIPDILAQSGARLVEVGTTNITTVEDYLSAITDDTALVLLVHTSNFRIRGFTEKPEVSEIARNLPPHAMLVVDQGSGATSEDIPGETHVRTYLKQGAALVSFSADKLLGGPQAGIIVGRNELTSRLAKHPLMRTFRCGKTVISLLEEYLVKRLNGDAHSAVENVLATSMDLLKDMGERILRELPQGSAQIVPTRVATGGGSGPDQTYPSLAVALSTTFSAGEIIDRLRRLPVPIIATVDHDQVKIELATMQPEDVNYVASSLGEILTE